MRKKNSRSLKKVIYFITEGACTEPAYIKERIRLLDVSSQKYSFQYIPGAKQQPDKILEIAKGRARETGVEKVFCVFDKDEHPHFDKVFNERRNEKIVLVPSVPCFEVWLYFHYEKYSTRSWHRHDLQKEVAERLAFKNAKQMKSNLKECVPTLIEKEENAMEVAKRLRTFHCKITKDNVSLELKECGNPSTKMDILIEELMCLK